MKFKIGKGVEVEITSVEGMYILWVNDTIIYRGTDAKVVIKLLSRLYDEYNDEWIFVWSFIVLSLGTVLLLILWFVL